MKTLLSGFVKALFVMSLAISSTSCGNDDPEPDPAPAPNPAGTVLTYRGTTTTYPVTDPASIYTSTKSTYTVTVADDGKSAVMGILNADFLQGMPQLGEMIFQPIECSFNNATNILSLNADEITPEIANRPFPAFPITDYSATLVPGKTAAINFICTYRGTPYQVTFKGSPATTE